MFRLVLAGLIAICSLPALSMTQVPFKADLTLSLVLPDANGNFSLSGDGNKIEASHLGRITYSGIGHFTDASHDVLTETLTAANGDSITILCNQTVTVIGPGLLQGSDVGTVIAGTGRFANATGNCIGQTNIDLTGSVPVVVKSYTGTISY